MEKTIKDYYFITDEELDELDFLASQSSYWLKFSKFLNSILHKPAFSITKNQKLYLKDMLDVLQK
jgi:hypothetical protein